MKKTLIIASLLAVVSFGFAAAANADTIIDGVVQYTGTVTATTVTLQIQCLDVATCGNWFLMDVSLKGFTFSGSPTLGPSPAGYVVANGGMDVSGGGGCNGTQPGKAVCWDAPTVLSTQLGSGVITFTANITGGASSGLLHVQALGFTNTSATQQGGGKVIAVSDDLTGGTVNTPEPASLALLGLGLIGVPFLRRKK